MRAMLLLLLLKLPVMQLLLMPPHAVCVAATLLMRLLPLLLLKPLHLPLLHTLPTMRLHSNARSGFSAIAATTCGTAALPHSWLWHEVSPRDLPFLLLLALFGLGREMQPAQAGTSGGVLFHDLI